MNPDKRLTIIEHLEELRQRLIRVVIALIITTGISFFFAEHIFRLLIRPAPDVPLIYTEVTEYFGTYVKVSLYSGVVLALPVLLYEIVMYISPALTSKEKRYLYALLPGTLISFFVGAAFGYFVLLPPALKFLLTFGNDIASPQIKIGNYISVVVRLLFWIGIVFELPVVMFFLSKIRILNPRLLSRYRRYAVVGAFVLGGIITPTFDPVNQTLVSVPLIALYELGIWLSKLAWRGQQRPVTHPDSAITH
ncbi:MAG: twin-arginine translocase subunit TatC [Chloroflexi bacterium]|nr:twin-arginine translocase subunit TatC [Chloroflexota bacterium]